jgi:twitching motility protein PilT
MMIERGQYDGPAVAERVTASGSPMLDELTRAARAARASDLYLGAQLAPVQRVNGELQATASGAISGELLSRELGIVAPAEARAAWERGAGVFAYSDAGGRVRVTLGRDQRGPSAALRLLPDEAPTLAQLGLPPAVEQWLGQTGLIAIVGSSGVGKTVTLAALVRALADARRRVVAIEDPIELIQPGSWVSQRALGTHVASWSAGVAAAMSEGADVIALGGATTHDAASALLDALAGGHLVVTSIAAPTAQHALDRLLGLLAPERRDHGRAVLGDTLLGTIRVAAGRGAGRTFEASARRS